MRFQTPLMRARLVRRYKRFLADIVLEDGREVVAHCANPGAMTGLAQPGAAIWVEPNDDPKKKLKYGWRLTELEAGHMACVDTGAANRLVRAALEHGLEGFEGYDQILPEQKYGEASRIDFLLRGAGRVDAYVEVKSVTLSRRTGLAEFPDTVTARGARHLHELAHVARTGARAVLLYVVQRSDCTHMSVAGDIDPAYAAAMDAARVAGMEIMALGAHPTPDGITLTELLPLL
ncbi:DNA/RNA nuclease SfsA [Roseovarius sp. LXJ103]|uniref:DNA/RNA nuclease SfsA n=1 Tax=Roseovarius carneus TaxID=2853164 RepID=UPI000D62062C|nr:DNA/RNA nuclease SfsA [Roseovarius carneus]MBZ8118863.1 DNA/RNA nuclease SfsA [Roseovarius carneus]PWE35475.1 DNA/RNA nuclease SfsA [Pelagicola sp. LXJ1103]